MKIIHSSRTIGLQIRSLKGFLLTSVAISLLTGTFAWADTPETTWNGTTVTWSTATNWSSGLPSATNSAEFNGPFLNQPSLGATAATTQGIWVTGATNTTGASGLTTISGTGILTITGTATLDSNTSAGILLDGTGNNSLTITAPVSLSNATSFLVNNSGTLTVGTLNLNSKALTLGGSGGSQVYNGVISSTSGSIAVNTSGTVTFNQQNTYTGGLTLTNGTVVASGANTETLGNGTVTLGGGVLDLQNVSGVTYVNNTAVTGNTQITSDLTASGTGTNYIFGTLSIGGQTLTIAGGSNVIGGTAAVTFGATTINGNANLTVTNPTGGGSTGLTLGSINSALTNTVTLAGNGAVTLTGAAGAISNGTTFVVGFSNTLNLNNATSLGIGVANVTDNGTVVLGNSNTLLGLNGGGGVTLGSNTLTVRPGIGTTNTYSGVMAGAGGLTVTGSGTGEQILSGANTYTGLTTVNSGTLGVSGSGTLGGSTATLKVAGGTLDLGGTNQMLGAVTFAGGTTQNGTLTGSSYSSTAATTSVVNAVLAGSGALSSAGTLTLGGVNTFTGGTTVTAGTLGISGSGTLGASTGTLKVSGGTLDLGGTSQTVGAVTFAGGTTQNGTLTGPSYTGSGPATVNAVLAGTGTLLASVNTLTLGGANTFSGATTISPGATINVANSLALQNSDVTINSGNGLTFNGINSATFAGLNGGLGFALTNVASGTGVTLSIGANDSATDTYTGNITGTGGINKIGTSTQIIGSQNNYTGITTISGGILRLNGTTSNGDILPNGSVAPTISTTSGSITATVSSSAGLEFGDRIYNNPNIPNGDTIQSISGNTITLSSAASSTATNVASNVYVQGYLGISTNAASNLVLNGGDLQYNTPVIMSTDHLFTLGASGGEIDDIYDSGVNNANNGNLSFTNTGAIVVSSTGSTLTLGGTNPGAYATATASNYYTSVGDHNFFDPTLGDGTTPTSLVKSGTGTWIITGGSSPVGTGTGSTGVGYVAGAGNTFTGGITVTGGVLQASQMNAIPNYTAPNISVSSGATLAVNVGGTEGGEFSTGTSGAGSIGGFISEINTGSFTMASGSTFGIDISNDGLTAGASNTPVVNYSGNITLNNISFADINQTLSTIYTSGLTLSGVLNLGTGGVGVYGGTYNSTVNANTILTLSGANVMTGVVTLGGGNLVIGNANALGTGVTITGINTLGSGIGTWAGSLSTSISTPTSQFIIPTSAPITLNLTPQEIAAGVGGSALVFGNGTANYGDFDVLSTITGLVSNVLTANQISVGAGSTATLAGNIYISPSGTTTPNTLQFPQVTVAS